MEDVNINDDLLIPSGRHTLPQSEVADRQRERLLRAIVAAVSERGYTDTTIADVVRIARTSRSAFYENFADKEECFLETYKQMTAGFIKASLRAAAEVSEWDAKLDVGIATYFRWMAEHPEVAIGTVVEVHAVGPAGLAARRGALRSWMRTIEGVATLAKRAGAKIAEPGEACYAAIVLTSEAYVHEYARRGRVARVQEKAPLVQALARTLFEHGAG
jgi:AcrR family transcriptional regulator